MKLSRKVSVVAATFLLAAATGQYMQSAHWGSGASPATPAPEKAAESVLPSKVTPLSAPVEDSSKALREAMPKLVPLSPSLPGVLRMAAKTEAAPTSGRQLKTKAAICHDSASISVDQGAMLDLTLNAPCHPSQRVVVRHAGLAFTELTDAQGKLTVQIPALQKDARVTVMFPGDQTISASAQVPELALYNRVALEWIGKDSFTLHALEFGAAFGSDGDVWAKNPGSPTPTTTAEEGFMTLLGNRSVTLPMVAQVYTYPTEFSTESGDVKLVIDANVTPATCGREMLAETLRTRDDAPPKSTDLSVAMPACGGPGGFVQLAGMLPDIKVAGD